jgi:hypothetical protein
VTAERELLERRADFARARLATTLEVLEQRARDAEHKVDTLRRAMPFVIVGLVLALPIVSFVWLSRRR